MSKRRNSKEIIIEVLRATSRKATKSRIMYDSFLNYYQLEKYLAYALGEGLIKKDGNLYTITKKGIEYLERSYEDASAKGKDLESSLR